MKIVAKFTIVYFALSCLVLVALAMGTAHNEVGRLRRSVAQDLIGAGNGLRDTLAVTWSVAGEERALAHLRSMDQSRSDVQVHWRGQHDAQAPTSSPEIQRTDHTLTVAIPVYVDDAYVGRLELERTHLNETGLLVQELWDEVPYAILLALLSTALVVLLGRRMIGQPLSRVEAQARRIGEGDFSHRLAAESLDEIGSLERELNTMCDQLEHARKRLEEETAARTATLQQLRHLDRLRMVGTFASSLAHQLGTPLNVVLIRAQSLSTDDCSEQERHEAGNVIVRQVERMSEIVRRLLDYSRKKSSEKQVVTLAVVVRQVGELLRPLARKNGVTLSLNLDENIRVIADADQLEQALSNLVMNGIQATPQGGTLTLSVSPATNAQALLPGMSSDLANIEVRDTGTGISEENLVKLSEPFFTTKPAGVGTGLGLSVAYGIVEEHGGKLSVTSQLGVGTTFHLYLPRHT